MARNYQKKGGNGGKREGAGRPTGSTNSLALGEVAAVNAAGLRVPESATQAERALADRALQRIAAVMEERVGSFAATAVLKASTHIREEICGAVKQKIEHSGLGDLTDEQLQAKYEAAQARIAAATRPPGGAGQEGVSLSESPDAEPPASSDEGE